MYRKNYTALFAVLTIMLSCHLGVNRASAQDKLESSEAGKRIAELIVAVNGTDKEKLNSFLKNSFANGEDGFEERLGQTENVRSQLGKLKFEKIVETTDHGISVHLSTSAGPTVEMRIQVSDDENHKISQIQVRMVEDESDSPSEESADKSTLDAATRTEVITTLADELRSKYVFPDVGEKMAKAIEHSLKSGNYDDVNEDADFASTLTEQLRSICNDKHLRVRPGGARRPNRRPGRRQMDNHGFSKVEMLPGGIGYLKFNFFSNEADAMRTATSAMNFLGNSKALIIDMRTNGGGSPDMIEHLCSYLFDKRTHLNSFYNRPTDTTSQTYSKTDVDGQKYGEDRPVYVLTSNRTFSAAEEFTYDLKHLKRGTIVGEVTGGGAHPVMPVQLGRRFHMTMPFARAINPITETNWEGVGVIPDHKVAASKALDKAIELATAEIAAAEKTVTSGTKKTDSAQKEEMEEVDLGELAQTARQLMGNQEFDESVKAFAKLTKLDPENGQAWFGYGYSLHALGQLDKAIEVHKKTAEFEQLAPIATYNLACAYALQKKTDLAIEALKESIGLGFNDLNQIENDSDLDSLHDDDRYKQIIKDLN